MNNYYANIFASVKLNTCFIKLIKKLSLKNLLKKIDLASV